MRFQANIDDGVLLTATDVETRADNMSFTYRMDNGSPYRAYLVNQLFHRRGAEGFQVDPNLTYTELIQGPILHLRKQLIEVPEWLDVEAPEVPYVTPVAAGESFSETINLRCPISPHDPYNLQKRTAEPYNVHRLIFTLGYLLEEQPVSLSEVRLPSGLSHWRIDYTDLLLGQRLATVGPIDATVLVVISPEGLEERRRE
jgi:hypothetical protein